MLTHENLLFTENFRCRVWRQHYFPAYTRVTDIAKQLGYPENKVQTAIRNRKRSFAEWDILWT